MWLCDVRTGEFLRAQLQCSYVERKRRNSRLSQFVIDHRDSQGHRVYVACNVRAKRNRRIPLLHTPDYLIVTSLCDRRRTKDWNLVCTCVNFALPTLLQPWLASLLLPFQLAGSSVTIEMADRQSEGSTEKAFTYVLYRV